MALVDDEHRRVCHLVDHRGKVARSRVENRDQGALVRQRVMTSGAKQSDLFIGEISELRDHAAPLLGEGLGGHYDNEPKVLILCSDTRDAAQGDQRLSAASEDLESAEVPPVGGTFHPSL